ncbi:MAG: VWA domain-containing protein [Archangium sp.]|nr:VWA domain-containing protein [Archangium sp.]
MNRWLKAGVTAVMMAGSALAETPQNKALEPQVVAKPTRPQLDVVFVLDTTSSMSGLIEGAKEKIWSIASRMASGTPTPRIRVGLVAYRDVGDTYVTKRFELTEDLDAMYANLKTLRAEGGGDGPEHVGRGLGEAVKLSAWSQDPKTAKMIFLVGDAPAHDDYNDGWNTQTWAKAAIAKGIVVNTIRCGNDATTGSQFRGLAALADGTFVTIGQAGGMVATATPFDAEIGKLNAAIAEKSIVAGAAPARHEADAKLAEMKAMPASVAADRISYKAKAEPKSTFSAAGNVKGTVDLSEKPAELAKQRKEDLPVEMQAMGPAEQAAYVAKVSGEKKELNDQLTVTNSRRDAWLQKNATEKKDSFDEQVFNAVKRQAAAAGVSY